MPSLTIRFATAEDVETIHRVDDRHRQTVGEREKVVSTPDDIRRFGFGEKPAFEALIAEVDGRLRRLFASSSPVSRPIAARPGVYVQDLFVEPVNSRARASAARLLQRLAAVTRERGGCYIRLSVERQELPLRRPFIREPASRHSGHRADPRRL